MAYFLIKKEPSSFLIQNKAHSKQVLIIENFNHMFE